MFQVVNYAALTLADKLRHIQEGPNGEIDESSRAALEVKKRRIIKYILKYIYISSAFFSRNGK